MAEPFIAIGLEPSVAASIVKNKKLVAVLTEVIAESGLTECPKAIGALLYQISTKWPVQGDVALRPVVARHVAEQKVKTNAQLDAALRHIKDIALKEIPYDLAAFEEASGVGMEITEAEIKAVVAEIIEKHKETLLRVRYQNLMLLECKKEKKLRWADMKVMKAELDAQLLALLGPITDEDREAGKKGKNTKKGKGAKKGKDGGAAAGGGGKGKAKEVSDDSAGAAKEEAPEAAETERRFHMPWENEINTKAMLDKHLKETGGKVITRFPPEPNGFLHIGHAKSMNLNFGYAKDFKGDCLLRFDDTNPEAEKQEYIDNIIDCVEWLGHKPTKITYSSDYFEELYQFAVKLIKDGNAYVDDSTSEEMSKQREERLNPPNRDRSVEENLHLFEDMRAGKYKDGEVTLRMKMDMQHPNPCMRDGVAYRVKHMAHPHAGDKWCIYPTYDMTHCVVDSLENITHSLCTLEFQIRRDSYYWLLEALEIYKPVQWEFSRLNITGTVMSKRKLQKLVEEGYVDGWEDPRLFTIAGLRRRGYTPEAINQFCKEVGVSRGDQVISVKKLEHCVRQDLDATCQRAFAVLDPVKVVIDNWPEDKREAAELPNHPKDKERGTRTMHQTREVYIERSDFRQEDAKGYFGLAPGKEVGLKYSVNITCTGVDTDENGNATLVHATYDPESKGRPKGRIHWVSVPDAVPVEVRLYEPLFTIDNPDSLGKDWMTCINKDSRSVCERAMVEPALRDTEPGARYQFERLGYFCTDRRDSKPGKLVFLRTLPLKEGKK